MKMTEAQAMELALDLALRGWGRVAPNPLVGAVLLKDGQLVGQGHHSEYGAPHAEVEAISNCEDPDGTTCVVNLEPCSHRGKTPPCTDALIMAGVKRVVFAIPDPDRAAAGGAEKLRAAGIDVEAGVLERDAMALNAPFLWSRARPDRPFIALKLATSMDGFMADEWGRSQWITGEEARAHAHWLRAGFDAIAVGRATADADDPQLTARGALEPRVPATRVVFTRSGRIASDLRLVRTAAAIPTTVIVAPEGARTAQESLRDTEVQLVVSEGLRDNLRELRSRGFMSVLVEAGPNLAGQLLA
ncbi:MAG: bifunctional diaminohydroxyphosphoribosylaminopyrimidine deaminase/5-amino-6-(5-phosphoribosylamino)uracil reductase RibD, partial [Gemmatimonadota bacterium]